MVTEDYSPFLISVIYLQDLGLLSYSHHRPLERVNWASPFWAGTRGQAALLGLPLFWGPMDGRLFSNPISCPPSPCVRTAWARAVIVPASIAISEVFLFLSHSWARRVSISSHFFDRYDEVLGFSRLYPVYTVIFRDGLESLFILAYLR